MASRGILAAVLAACAFGPASGIAGATGLYVSSRGSDSISAYSIGSDGTPAPILCNPGTACHTGGGPTGIAIDPSGRHLYVANTSAGSVSAFTIGSGGALSPIACGLVTACDAGTEPSVAAVAPDGRHLFVSDAITGVVHPFAIAADGSLAPVACGSCSTGGVTWALGITPDGRYLYATIRDQDKIAAFQIAADGSLSPTDCAPPNLLCTTGVSPYGLVIHPSGRFLYTSSVTASSRISAYAIDADGSLIPLSCGTSCDAGDDVYGLVIDPSGTHLYAVNYGTTVTNGGVSAFGIGTDGRLAPITCSLSGPCAAGTESDAIAMDPAGRHVYVTSYTSGSIYAFALGSTGAPSPLTCDPSGACATGLHPDYFSIAAQPDQGPTAAFQSAPATAGSASTFDASASTDPDGQVARYDWDFGDGQTASAATPQASHAYASPGTYTVTLTATDDIGCSTTIVFTGQTASCNGTPAARATAQVQIPPVAGPPAPVAPVLASFTQGARRWRLGSALPKITSARRMKVGTTFAFSINQPGTVRLAFSRLLPGRRTGGRCVAPTTRNRRKPRCTRARASGSLTFAVAAGAHKVRFAGRLSRTRRLRLGRHRVTLTASNAAGLRSSPRRLTFTIVR